MTGRSFQGQIIDGYQLTIPKPTRLFEGIDIGDIVDVTVNEVMKPLTRTCLRADTKGVTEQ